MNQERVIYCLFAFDSRVSSKPFWTKPLFGFGEPNLVHCLSKTQKEKKIAYSDSLFLFLNVDYFVHGQGNAWVIKK